MPSEKAQHLPRQSKGTQLEVKSQLFNTVSAEQPVSVNIFHGEKEESVIQKWQNSSKKQWMESGAFTTPAAPKVSQNCAHSVVLLLHDTHLCSQSYLRICIHRNLNTHIFFCTQLQNSLLPAQQILLCFAGGAALSIRPKQMWLQKESESSYVTPALACLFCHSTIRCVTQSLQLFEHCWLFFFILFSM